MNTISDSIGSRIYTESGQYTIIYDCGDYGTNDARYSVWIGRDDDGHCDMLISDNASVWALGDADDAERNRNLWDAATAEVDADMLIAYGRDVDADLGDWLAARWKEAKDYDMKLVPMKHW